MLSSIRKFSSTIFAKILLGIVVIPFIFWGMGSSFTGGSKNIVLIIEKEKYSNQEFVDFIQKFAPKDKKINSNQIEEFLSVFISQKIIEREIEYFGIKLSDASLSNLIKHQENFKRENKFSRAEYEKFLLINNFNAASFEANLAKYEKKKQFIEFISGGISPSNFLVNAAYDEINQKRNIQLINLNDLFTKQFNFSEDQIKSYYESNKDNYKEIYKTVKIIELNPKELIGNDEFNDLFFKKIDEIDDIIIEGQNLAFILQKFNLENIKTFTFNKFGKDINSRLISSIPEEIIKNIFSSTDAEQTILVENKDKYFLAEIIKSENILRTLENENIKKTVLLSLQSEVKKKLISEISSKINANNFIKSDFDKLSFDKNLTVKKITLENQRDIRKLKNELVNEIYKAPEKKVIIVYDIGFTENFLIYIDKIQNVTIDKESDEYKQYLDISKNKIKNGLLNTYDEYIKNKYKIDINYKALEIVKNYFN